MQISASQFIFTSKIKGFFSAMVNGATRAIYREADYAVSRSVHELTNQGVRKMVQAFDNKPQPAPEVQVHFVKEDPKPVEIEAPSAIQRPKNNYGPQFSQ